MYICIYGYMYIWALTVKLQRLIWTSAWNFFLDCVSEQTYRYPIKKLYDES